MLRLINTHAENECIKQIRQIEEQRCGSWHKFTIKFHRQDIFDYILTSPLSARKRIDAILDLHAFVAGKLTADLPGEIEAVLYAFEDKDLMLLADLSPGSAALMMLQDLTASLQKDYSELAEIRLIPLAMTDINLVHDAEAHKIAAKEWQMYETLIDTTKCRTISQIRSRREKPVVLVVEDDEFVGYQINEFLKDHAGIIFVKTAEEAIQYYIDMAPDCVLLDVHLPGRNGFQALHCIRKIDPDANILILTGDLVSANAQKAFHMGALNFMEKPLYRDQLVMAVKDAPLFRKATRIKA